MIGTKTRGYTDAAAFFDVANYIRRDPAMMRPGDEPVIALGCANVASPETWALESSIAYALSDAQKPTLTHRTISWEPRRIVSAEEARETFDRLRAALGMPEQPALWSLNADGDEKLYHIHVAFSGINPDTLRCDHFRENDYATVSDMLRQMELEYGWASGAKGAAREASEAVQAAEEIIIGARVDTNARRILENLTKYQAHFSRQHVSAALAKAKVVNPVQEHELREKVFGLAKQIGPDAWTTDAVWKAENRVTAALDGLGTGFCGIEGGVPRAGLTEQQVRAYDYALAPGARRKLITGVAGAGKSYVVRDVAATYEAAGYNVRAVSVTHAACGALEKQTSIPTRTVTSELWRQGNRDDAALTADDVLIIDEVSTLGTEQAADLLEAADRAGSIVIGFGDHKQFGSVGYGNVIAEWRRLDAGIDLDKTVRQEVTWQREATENMRAGRVREALDAYRDKGMIHRHRTQKGARAKLVERWKSYENARYEVAVSTYSNRERIKLSQQIRVAHRELGRLIGDDVMLDVQDGRLPFAVGERVTVRGNLPELGLRNGMAATVVGIHGTTLQLDRNGTRVDLDTSAGPDHRAVEHGYVATTYREMGATRTVSLNLLTRYENSASFNVAFSRHTHAFEMFFSHEHSGSYENVVAMASHDRVKRSAHEVADIEQRKYQAQEQAKVAAQERAAQREQRRAEHEAHAKDAALDAVSNEYDDRLAYYAAAMEAAERPVNDLESAWETVYRNAWGEAPNQTLNEAMDDAEHLQSAPLARLIRWTQALAAAKHPTLELEAAWHEIHHAVWGRDAPRKTIQEAVSDVEMLGSITSQKLIERAVRMESERQLARPLRR